MIQKNKKRSPLETRLIFRRWSESQEGKMSRKLWESKQFLKSIGIKT
jgi:hypothetical protein